MSGSAARKASASVWGRSVRLAVLCVALVPVGLAVVAEAPVAVDRPLFDWLMRTVTPKAPPSPEVVYLDIDDESLKALGERWPIQRLTWARILGQLAQFRPAAVAVDAFFAEPANRADVDLALDTADKIYEGKLDATQAGKDLALDLERQAALRDADRQLTKAIADAGNVILGLVDVERMPDALTIAAKVDLPPIPGVPAATRVADGMADVRGSLPVFTMSARGQASLHVSPDSDGIVRRYPYLFRVGAGLTPSLALAAVQAAHPARAAAFGKQALDRDGGRPLIAWVSKAEVRRVRVADLLDATPASAGLREGLQGRIVFVGVSALGASDRRATTVRTDLPGTVIHMTAAMNLLADRHVESRSATARWLGGGALLSCLLVFGAGIRLRSNALNLGVAVAGVVVWGAVAVVALQRGLALPILPVWFGMLLPALAEVLLRANQAEEARKQIRNAFQHYLSPAVIEELVRDPDKLKLGGERRDITAFFSDVAGFTSISEQLDPADLTRLLNAYLSAMTEIVLQEGGTVDKYIGDAIVAMFGAPLHQDDHAVRACRAAVRCVERLAELRLQWQASGLPEIDARIGLNSGAAVVGNMGSSMRFDYTMLGDVVNLASRLESANKAYGTRVMCGEETARQVGTQVPLRELDLVRVKGKKQGVAVYEVLTPSQHQSPQVQASIRDFSDGLQAWRAGRWQQAHTAFAQAAERGDVAAGVFVQRIAMQGLDAPTTGWDGVFEMTSK